MPDLGGGCLSGSNPDAEESQPLSHIKPTVKACMSGQWFANYPPPVARRIKTMFQANLTSIHVLPNQNFKSKSHVLGVTTKRRGIESLPIQTEHLELSQWPQRDSHLVILHDREMSNVN